MQLLEFWLIVMMLSRYLIFEVWQWWDPLGMFHKLENFAIAVHNNEFELGLGLKELDCGFRN
jgi:hypothetical protein